MGLEGKFDIGHSQELLYESYVILRGTKGWTGAPVCIYKLAGLFHPGESIWLRVPITINEAYIILCYMLCYVILLYYVMSCYVTLLTLCYDNSPVISRSAWYSLPWCSPEFCSTSSHLARASASVMPCVPQSGMVPSSDSLLVKFAE